MHENKFPNKNTLESILIIDMHWTYYKKGLEMMILKMHYK